MRSGMIGFLGASNAENPWSPSLLGVEIQHDHTSPVTLVGSGVSLIGNIGALGASGDHVQAASARRPTTVIGAGGRRALRFDGTQQLLQCATTPARQLFAGKSGGWMLAVMRKLAVDGSTVNRGIVTSPPGNSGGYGRLNLGIGASAPNRVYLYSERVDGGGGALIESALALDTAAHIILARVDWSTAKADIYVDGALWASSASFGSSGSTSATNAFHPIALGAYAAPAPYTFCDMELSAEIQSGAGFLSDTDREKVEGWAAWEFGLVANLPVGHPYKDAPPMA